MWQQPYYGTAPMTQMDWALLAQQWIAMKDQVNPPQNMLRQPTPVIPRNQIPTYSGRVVNMDIDPCNSHTQTANCPPHLSFKKNETNFQQNLNHNISVPSRQFVGNNPTINTEPLQHSHPPILMNNQHKKKNYDVSLSISADEHANKSDFRKFNDASMKFNGSVNHIPIGNPRNTVDNKYMSSILPSRYNSSSSKPDYGLSVSTPPPIIDASARKKLPSWIREGLEKMEQEKVKKELNENNIKQREENRKLNQQNSFNMSNKFDDFDDGENDDETEAAGISYNEDINNEKANKVQPRTRVSRFNSNIPEPTQQCSSIGTEFTTESRTKNKLEFLQVIDIQLRRALTDILLTVTNSEIESIAREVCSKMFRKNSSSKHHGLGQLISGYGSDSEEQENNELSPTARNDESSSEEEESLRLRIHKMKQGFQSVQVEILKECDAIERGYKIRKSSWIKEGDFQSLESGEEREQPVEDSLTNKILNENLNNSDVLCKELKNIKDEETELKLVDKVKSDLFHNETEKIVEDKYSRSEKDDRNALSKVKKRDSTSPIRQRRNTFRSRSRTDERRRRRRRSHDRRRSESRDGRRSRFRDRRRSRSRDKRRKRSDRSRQRRRRRSSNSSSSSSSSDRMYVRRRRHRKKHS